MTITAESEVGRIAFLPGGLLAGLCADGKARVWDPRSGALKRTVAPDKGDSDATLLGASSQMAALGKDGSVKVWNLETGEKVRRLAGPEHRVRGLAATPELSLIAGASVAAGNPSERIVHVVDGAGRSRFDAAAGLGGTSVLAFAPGGSVFAVASYDTSIRAFNSRNGELLRHIEEIPVATFAMVFSPDGRMLATGGADRIVRLWDTANWSLARRLEGQPEMISALAWAPDGKRLLSGGFSELTTRQPVSVILWDAGTGRILRKFDAAQRVDSVAFSPDGSLAAMSCRRKEVAVWSLA